jgi:hypothetical protein
LEDELQWPDAENGQELAAVFPGMFHGCIGMADVKEYQVVKYLDPVKERRSWSGKKKINSYKLLSVMDHSGHYIFACLCLGKNDHEVFTASPLYLQEGECFSVDEFVAADGAFEGDGRLRCSFKNPGNDEVKKLWNLAFHEVRTGVENSYQRTGAWFPLIGNNKCKLPYSDQVSPALYSTVHFFSLSNTDKFLIPTLNTPYRSTKCPCKAPESRVGPDW